MTVGKVHELSDGLADSEILVFEANGHLAPAEETEVSDSRHTMWPWKAVWG